ncbi:8-oxo-dGTP diphosphatase MutT [Fastidiosibacter lacustris]|uniref:8-oxo-dGTP diphosphatase MutT n=1 Tax=Fastidiosibacter lacustris TaxID=2056695 RepID=UPI000E350B71|nr:8-oxo-dGTP diphosphatase MutT [Fastidiosibacter lacustris]
MILIKVAIGVILNDQKNQVFLTKRKESQHLAGLWEFPGGKIKPNESPEAALIRELKEEVGIYAKNIRLLMVKTHNYGDKVVELNCYIVNSYSDLPMPKENQQGKWILIEMLSRLKVPRANHEIIEALLQQLNSSGNI